MSPSKGTVYLKNQELPQRITTKPALTGHSSVFNKTVTADRIEKHEEPVLEKDGKMRLSERLALQQRNIRMHNHLGDNDVVL